MSNTMQNITKDKFIEILTKLSNEGNKVKSTRFDAMGVTCVKSGSFDAWRNKILAFFDRFPFIPSEIYQSIYIINNEYLSSVDAVQEQISSLIDLIQKDYILCEAKRDFNATLELENIFTKFHKVARQLRTRHKERPTLSIGDEYDVQDLLYALLLLHFDDVRAEEWTPSYAGSCVRMDFLLKDIQTVIEVKKTRPSMSSKDLGEELIIDIEKYQSHPDCKKLYCFVYDPEGYLGNPIGIKNDLETAHKDFLKVFIKPE